MLEKIHIILERPLLLSVTWIRQHLKPGTKNLKSSKRELKIIRICKCFWVPIKKWQREMRFSSKLKSDNMKVVFAGYVKKSTVNPLPFLKVRFCFVLCSYFIFVLSFLLLNNNCGRHYLSSTFIFAWLDVVIIF